MKFEFIADLDEYFCEKYANYDKLCVLEGYRMPKMQDTREDAFGRKYSYTLPASTMCLANQEKKAELLAQLKEKMTDKNFSFSFRPLGFFARLGDRFSKQSFRIFLSEVCRQHGLDPKALAEGLDIDPVIWKKILKGAFYPSKNLIFAIAVYGHLGYRDTKALLQISGYDFDFTNVRDVVLSYLLSRSIFNMAMVDAALEEYKVQPLLIKKAE